MRLQGAHTALAAYLPMRLQKDRKPLFLCGEGKKAHNTPLGAFAFF